MNNASNDFLVSQILKDIEQQKESVEKSIQFGIFFSTNNALPDIDPFLEKCEYIECYYGGGSFGSGRYYVNFPWQPSLVDKYCVELVRLGWKLQDTNDNIKNHGYIDFTYEHENSACEDFTIQVCMWANRKGSLCKVVKTDVAEVRRFPKFTVICEDTNL